MRAFAIKSAGVADVVELPEVADDGGVLLRVELIGMCGTDLTTFRGRNAMVEFPRVIGHEVAATVMEDAGDLKAGTLVTVLPYTSCGACPSCRRGRVNACQFNQTMGVQRDGALREWLRVPQEKLYTGALSLRELCLVEPLTVGTHAAARGRVTKDDVVAVFGCGGVGLGAIAGAAFRGAEVIAIDQDEAKLEVARMAGARHGINTARENLHARLQAMTGGRGPDVVIEAIGLPETFRAAVEEVAFTGRVVYIGYAKEPVTYETRLFVQKELDLLGSRNALAQDFAEVIRMLEAKRFPVEDAISVVVGMEDAARVLAEWSAAPGRYTKIMVQVR